MAQRYYTKILGTGSAFPQRSVSNAELAASVDTSDEWIYERTGIRNRRIASLKGDETNSGMAARAALAALEVAKTTPEEIDRIIVATVSPDHVIPNASCALQERIGAKNAAAFDLSAACSGFVYGLELSNALIQSGMAKKILLVGSEVLSSFVNWKDRGTCILFGDGAGAVVLGRSTDESSQICSTHLQADGWSKDLFYITAGGSSIPVSHATVDENLQFMQMKGREIFKVAVKMLADCSERALEKSGYSISDVDWIVPHQANLRIIEALAKRMQVPMQKVILNIEDYGNTSSATVPSAFDLAVREGRIRRGDLVLFTVFGAGLTYGASVLRY
ncbi:MAG TPA: beta-ketoacyl-ACP synthase III [Oligoflexia bacterium]|nr:beta-ketoacyl-ACP synthase III [Oligoflexia bacterium]